MFLKSFQRCPKVKAELSRLCGLYNPVRLQHNVNKAVFASSRCGKPSPPASLRVVNRRLKVTFF
jgi:hypothetical protein